MKTPTINSLSTQSPVNALSIDRQNSILLAYLKTGKTIHFIHARTMGIGFLNSRISDLIKNDVVIYKRWVNIGSIHCKEYSLTPFI
jgi:hypothetical protein